MNWDATIRTLLFIIWLVFWRALVPAAMVLAVMLMLMWELWR